jgi:hypothetical protein
VLTNLVHTRWRGPVDSKIRSRSGAWGLPAEPFDKHKPCDWPDTGASLTLILIVSLGLWAALWGTVASLAAVLG